MTNEIITVEKETNEVIQKANQIVVTNNEQETTALEFCKTIKRMQSQVSETFDPLVQKAYETHKEATAQRSKFLNPLKEAESRIKSLVLTFRDKIERERIAEENRLREIAEKQAEKERQALLKKAEKAIEKGNEEKAEELKAKAEEVKVVHVTVASPTIKQDGMSVKKIWKARIINPNLVPREYCEPNIKYLNDVAKSTAGTLKISGVEFYQESSMGLRA